MIFSYRPCFEYFKILERDREWSPINQLPHECGSLLPHPGDIFLSCFAYLARSVLKAICD